MTDYTPTTERVRAAYSNYLAGLTRAEAKAELLALEFDRWLAEVKAQAWEEGHTTALRYSAYFGEHVPNPYRPKESE